MATIETPRTGVGGAVYLDVSASTLMCAPLR